MKLYVPEIGDRIELTSDWSFNLHAEKRNRKLFELLGYFEVNKYWTIGDSLLVNREKVLPYDEYFKKNGFVRGIYGYHIDSDSNPIPGFKEKEKEWQREIEKYGEKSLKFTLPKETILRIDRIYIRKGIGYSDFSSMSFVIDSCPNKELKKKRFWAKLSDCNTIEFQKAQAEKKTELYWPWGYSGAPSLGTGIINPTGSLQSCHYNLRNKPENFYVCSDKLNGNEKIFSVETIKKTRPATEEEIDSWYEKERETRKVYGNRLTGGWFAIDKPKEMEFVEYNKMYMTHIPTGKLIGKYTSMDSMKARARKILEKN